MKKSAFLLSYIKKKNICILMLLMILSAVLGLCPPFITKFLLDNGIIKPSVKIVLCCGICLICIYSVSFLINYVISQSLTKTSTYYIADLKKDLFAQILKLPMEFFDKQQAGYVLERMKEADALNVFFSP